MIKKSMGFIGKAMLFFLLVLSCSFFCGLKAEAAQGGGFVHLSQVFQPKTVTLYLQEVPAGYKIYGSSSSSSAIIDAYSTSGIVSNFHLASFTYRMTQDDFTALGGTLGNSYLYDYLFLDYFSPNVTIDRSKFGYLQASNFYYAVSIDGNPVTDKASSYVSTFFTGLHYGEIVFDVYADLTFFGYAGGSNATSTNNFSFDFNFSPSLDCVIYNFGSSQKVPSLIVQQTDQMNNQFNQVNNSLTNFSGSGALNTSKDQLDGVIAEYDQVEGSLFDSGQAAFDKFDPSSLLDFSAGIVSAMGYISQLMIGIISAMGEFSSIYTVGFVLVFFGMLIGLWRFFIDD